VLVQARFPRQTSNRPWRVFDLCDLHGGTGHIWLAWFEINCFSSIKAKANWFML